MINLNNLTTIDVETINNCNAACPLCLRGSAMKTNDVLDWDSIVKNVPSSVWEQLIDINFNGTTGDNLMHPKIYDIIEWTKDNTSACINIHTNGSIRSTKWWEQFGNMLQNSKHRVVFGIDGLEDTHHLYRINTSWKKIIENAQAFIHGGGKAEWQFILFDHNKHQVEECRELAKSLGFHKFFTIFQDRFDTTQEIKTINGSIKRHDPTKLPENTIVKESSIHMHKTRLTGSKEINCRSQQVGWVSIYADGTVWPCCWLMGWHLAKHQKIHYNLINYHFNKVLKIDFDQINLYYNNLESILSSDLWANRYPDSFKKSPNLVCIQQCSK